VLTPWQVFSLVLSACTASYFVASYYSRRREVVRQRAFAEIRQKYCPPSGTKRIVRMKEAPRPCRECGKPLDMSDGAELTQYDDGSLGCREHAEEP
jgi:hypothetical protein